MSSRLSLTCSLLCALTAGGFVSHAMATEWFGPAPYLNPLDTPDGFVLRPSAIENFEDGSVDPRLRIVSSGSIIGPGGLTDSVDGDDGALDGSGTQGRSWLSPVPFEVEFDPPYPASAALVWTDGGTGSAQFTFEAFGADGQSLGTIGPVTLGDANNAGGTAEDRFFGTRHEAGIRRLRMSPGGIEVDHIQYSSAVEPAILSTLEDGSAGRVIPAPDAGLPNPFQVGLLLADGTRPHGLAFLGGGAALFADFSQPRLVHVAFNAPDSPTVVALPGRTSTNGSLAVDPNGRYALSIGETNAASPVGEAVVVDFGVEPPLVSPIAGGLRVLSFVTAAIDFAPDGRAFVCHTGGVSVLRRPYTDIEFTMPFPPLALSPSMCALSRDGARLFVTRMLSETVPTVNAIRTTAAPFSATSAFTEIPAPPDVQGLGPLVVSPAGDALLVGQQFLFPPLFAGTRARAFVVRPPFDAGAQWSEIALPAGLTGETCTDQGQSEQCPAFEHIALSADGSLAILTGNSATEVSGAADGVPAVFVRAPFDDAARSVLAVQIDPDSPTPGRGTGGARFQPMRVFADGMER